MSDDYLWDGSGEPDKDVERLEKALGGLRYDRPAPELPRGRFLRWAPTLLAVAAAALVAVALWYRPSGTSTVTWAVEALDGAPLVGAIRMGAEGRIGVGETLETDDVSRARVHVADIGWVDLSPSTRVRLVATGEAEHRMALDRGRIDALISAPPRLFLVETVSAVAVDLGCAYTLEIDDAGAGALAVTFGWVSLEREGRRVAALGQRDAFRRLVHRDGFVLDATSDAARIA